MRISIGSDHRGVEVRQHIVEWLRRRSEVVDRGYAGPGSCDYPDVAAVVAGDVAAGKADRGILICHSGIGMSIAANKIQGIRAALVHDVHGAEMSRRHNDSNVLCLSADQLNQADWSPILERWLSTEFEGGRHQRRVEKIRDLEKCPPDLAPP